MKINILIKIFFILVCIFFSSVAYPQSSQNTAKELFNIKLSCLKSMNKQQLYFLDKEKSFRMDTLKVKSVSTNGIYTQKQYKIHPVRLGIVLGGMTIAWLGMHIYYSNTWWKDRAHYFKFAEDPYYARDVDKLSHIYTADLITVSSAKFYEWSGMNPTLALAIGSVTAIAYETYIEINDGLAPIWGFDWGDMAGNFIGALYPIAQKYVKPLRSFNIKWSFVPQWLSNKFRKYPDLLDDYTSMKFWITVNPKDLLPKKIAKYYPSFLGFGLGINLQNASHATGATNAYREYYLAFDIDVTRLPGNTDFLKKLKEVLNFYHIPMPGVKLYRNTIWYGLLF
jgi:Predicted periplasmic lipoprotein (DUF2279)